MQTSVVNPAPNLPVVAVAPFLNLSAERAADGRRFALAYATELQQVPGFEVVPVGVVEVAMKTSGLDPSDPAEAVALAQLIGADSIVVGAVTDYSPYYPPRVGLKTAWYARESAIFSPGPTVEPGARRALGEAVECETPAWKRGVRGAADLFRAQSPDLADAPLAGAPVSVRPPAPLPYMSYVRLYDGADEDVAAALRDRRALSGDLRSGGWEAQLNRSEDFIRFCCRRSIQEMLELHGGLAEREYILRCPECCK
ncbi:hypothetical protein [Alienimonas chondri]|uniref:Uncharacterized protein n=1 Tax=Alienimonas chondri TaxID=2681879 RepID=A0ABX1VFJ6_9PLAN|nr:hypothetical protein [Alienimonas chondri]NNJ26878.1 hypothetical protein [Alienimonas chondri]